MFKLVTIGCNWLKFLNHFYIKSNLFFLNLKIGEIGKMMSKLFAKLICNCSHRGIPQQRRGGLILIIEIRKCCYANFCVKRGNVVIK